MDSSATSISSSTTSGVMVRILGPVAIANEDIVVDVGPAQRRQVLAVLAAGRRSVISTDSLIDGIWGDSPPGSARKAVQVHIHHLRADLGVPIVSTNGGYRLDDSVRIDAEMFEELVGEARALADSDVGRAVELFARSRGLWSGRAFGGIEDLPVIEPERVRLEELRLVAAEGWYAARLAAGAGTELIPDLERSVAEHPLRDRLRQQLMLALHRAGRQREALTAFQEYRAELADAGLEPSAATVDLERQIAVDDPELSPAERRLRGYSIADRLGEGAFSIVYRGRQPSVNREVAIKQIRAELANRPEFIRRFEAEAQMVASLEHPHVVPLIDFWREPGAAYLVMRLLRGGSLEAALTEGPWEVDATVRMASQVASALDAAHRAGIVHRDVKPANILLDDDGWAYLTDFGIALTTDELHDAQAALSAGSPAYASPEQLRRDPVGPATDVHGLAIAVFESLTGHLPFPDEPNRAAALRRQLEDPIPLVRSIRPELAAVDEVLQRATEKHPADRHRSPGEFADDLATALASGAGDAYGGRSGIRGTVIALEDRNPYKGLRAFDESDAADFSGRDRLVDQLVATLAAERALTVVGPSGSGKSSVVRAGLLPALRGGAIIGSDRWFIATMVPSAHPFEEFEDALARLATEPTSDLLTMMTESDRGMSRSIRRALPEDGELLLVVDQFEELFTMTSHEDRQRFLRGLAAALTEERSRLRVVFTLRADFYDRPLRHETIAKLVRDTTVAVLPLAADELEHAIVNPAHAVGAEFEPGLVSELVADVSDQPGALPMLQYALTELYEQRVSGLILRDAYHRMGGVAGALAKAADDLHQQTAPDVQRAIRTMFGQLVTLGEGAQDTRRRVLTTTITAGHRSGSTDASEEAHRLYGDARLLTFDRDPTTREPTTEVAHEALIREWPRLRLWLEEDRDDLRTQRHLQAVAEEWNAAGRPASELYRGGRLETAQAFAANNPDTLSPEANAFLVASTDHHNAGIERERKTRQRLQRLLAGVGVIAVLALVAGAVAFQQRNEAQDRQSQAEEAQSAADGARQEAETARQEEASARATAEAAEQAALDTAFAAETGRLVAQAEALADQDTRIAALLAVAAHQRDPSAATLGALQRVLRQPGLLSAVSDTKGYTDIAPIDEERVLATHPQGIDVFNLTEGEVLTRINIDIGTHVFGSQAGDISSRITGDLIDVSQDGSIAVVATANSEVAIVDLGRNEIARRFVFGERIESVDLRPDGEAFALVDGEFVLHVFETTGAELLVRDLADWTNSGEMYRDLTGKEAPPWASEVDLRPSLTSTDEELIVSIEGLVSVWDWTGSLLEPATLVEFSLQDSANGYQVHRRRDGSLYVLNGITVGLLDRPLTGGVVTSGIPLEGTIGGGAPGVRSWLSDSEDELRVVLDDGSLATFSLSTGTRLDDRSQIIAGTRVAASSPVGT